MTRRIVLQVSRTARTWISKHARVLSVALVWSAILAAGLVGAEVYARIAQKKFLVWNFRLSGSWFTEHDRMKIWNRRWTDSIHFDFREWPVPLEFFDSGKLYPMYLYQPNLRMALHGNTLAPAKPGEPVYWSSNSLGLRNPEFSVEKKPGVLRIVCIGASTTEGSQGDQETYPVFLQQDLNRLYPDQQLEVINAGHYAYDIDSILEFLRQQIFPLKPDIVIFYEGANNHFAELDFTRDWSCELGSCWLWSYPPWYRWLYMHSSLFQLLTDGFGLNSQEPPPMPHVFDDTGPKPKVADYMNGVRQIVRETQAHGIRLVLSSFIDVDHEGLQVSYKENRLLFDNLYKVWYPFTPGEHARIFAYINQQLGQIAQESDVPFADVAAEFPKDIRYFPYDYIHLSPEGNRLLASLFAKFLAKEILPSVINQDAAYRR